MDTTSGAALSQRTVGDLVAEDYRRGVVFKHFGIDFCCGGRRSVADACAAAGASLEELDRALQDAARHGESTSDPRTWEIDFLVDYIVQVHHGYVRQRLPVLVEFAAKTARVHGEAHPELAEVARIAQELAAEMASHMHKEEHVLFPYVKELASAQKNRTIAPRGTFGSVRHPVAMMEHEHDHAGELVRNLRELSNGFTPPAHACNTYRAMYASMEEFESDLHRHVHLENNVLFPRAIALEEELVGDA